MIEERGSENSIIEYKKREMNLSKQRYLIFWQWNSQLNEAVVLDNNTCAYNFCKIFFLGFHQVSR